MKINYAPVLIFTFFIVFAKVLFDLTIFANFFQNSISHGEWFYFFFFAFFAGGAIVWLYNIAQRLFSFSTAMFLLHCFLFLLTVTARHKIEINHSPMIYACLAGLAIPLNIIIILVLKGFIARIIKESGNHLEKAINIAKYSGILLAGLFIIGFQEHTSSLNSLTLLYRSGTFFALSYIACFIVFLNNSQTTAIIDNAQEIKVKHSVLKLISDKYFLTILFSTTLIAVLLTLSFIFFKSEISNKYKTGDEVIIFLAQYSILIALASIVYELFLKIKAFYFLGVRNSMLVMPLAMLLLSMLLIAVHLLNITEASEFHLFVIMFSALFMMGTHFSFENLMFPTLNALYSPLEQRNRNDYYIKSCMFGLLTGLGAAGLIYKYTISYVGTNQFSIIIVIVILIPIVFLVLRYGLYEAYRNKLKENLNNMKVMSTNKNTFIYRMLEHINDYNGIQLIRAVNLSHLINPIIFRDICKKLIPSEDNFRQRVGIIKADNLCLLETKDQLKELTSTKYFAASPNRDKIEHSLHRFEAINKRMNKQNYIEQLSISKKEDERVFGAKLCRYSDKEVNNIILLRLIKDPILQVVKNVLISSEKIEDGKLIKSIIEKLGNPTLANSAYSSLLQMNPKYLPVLDDAFYQTGQTEKVQLRIIQLFSDIGNDKAIEFLLKKLNYTNQNIIASALQALSKCIFTLSDDKSITIKHELNELCQVLVWNMSMLSDIKGQKCSDLLVNAMETEIKYNYESLFNLLALLTDAKTIHLIKINIQSSDFYKITFALELASIVLKDELKTTILPLLQPMPPEDKVRKLQEFFPSEKMNKREILYNIIQHDYKWINRWTKACALKELASEKNKDDMSVFLANMVNPDIMLAELAALSAFELNPKIYWENKNILGLPFVKKLGKNTIAEIEKDGSQLGMEKQIPLLKFDIIKYIREIAEFSAIPGEVLKKLTDHVIAYKFQSGEIIEDFDYINDHDGFYIVYSGQVNIYLNDILFHQIDENMFLSTLDFLYDECLNIKFVAETEVQIFRILANEFTELLSFYDEIPESVFINTKTDNRKLYEDLLKRRALRTNKPNLIRTITFEQVQLN